MQQMSTAAWLWLLAWLAPTLSAQVCRDEYEAIRSQFQELRQQRQLLDNKDVIMLQTSTDSSQVQSQSYKQGRSKQLLDLSGLTKILDHTETTVTVQAKCTFDALVQYTLLHTNTTAAYRKMPAVVPEFKSITVGGAIMGGALESTSFKYGQVSDTALSYTMLLSNGTLVTINDSHELFHSLPGSYGTLGILLDATLKIQPVQEYVQVKLLTFDDMQEGLDQLAYLSNTAKYDFLDALYIQEKVVVCAGTTTSTVEPTSTLIDTESFHSLWMYEQVEDALFASNSESITMPIYDYLFRYERGAFWMARPVRFQWIEIFKNPMLTVPFVMSWRGMRRFFGKIFTATNLYRVLHKADAQAIAETFVIMDAYMPAKNAAQLAMFVRENVPISVPLWFCPVTPSTTLQPLSPTGSATELIINVGIWGRVSDRRGKHYTKQLERKIAELSGRKMLYSQSGLTPTELYETMVDGVAYRRLKEQYDPKGVFPELHEKLQLTSKPVNGTKKSLKYWMTRLVL